VATNSCAEAITPSGDIVHELLFPAEGTATGIVGPLSRPAWAWQPTAAATAAAVGHTAEPFVDELARTGEDDITRGDGAHCRNPWHGDECASAAVGLHAEAGVRTAVEGADGTALGRETSWPGAGEGLRPEALAERAFKFGATTG